MKTITIFLLVCMTSIHVNSQSSVKDSMSSEIKSVPAKSFEKSEKPAESDSQLNWLMISAIIGIFGSSFVWAYNEWQKRKTKLVSEKEERYRLLIKYIRSFGSGSNDDEKANEFIVELQQCWMYCPDIVIEKGNNFLTLLKEGDQAKTNIAKGEFVLEMRRDLLRSSKLFKSAFKKNMKTKLNASDFLDVYYKS